MSNADRWDHSGYKELQNEEKSNSMASKRSGTNKKFYKFKEGNTQNDKNMMSEYIENSQNRKNASRKYVNYGSNKHANEDWQHEIDKEKIYNPQFGDLEINNHYKNKQKKKKKEEFYKNQNHDTNTENSQIFYKKGGDDDLNIREKNDQTNNFNNATNTGFNSHHKPADCPSTTNNPNSIQINQNYSNRKKNNLCVNYASNSNPNYKANPYQNLNGPYMSPYDQKYYQKNQQLNSQSLMQQSINSQATSNVPIEQIKLSSSPSSNNHYNSINEIKNSKILIDEEENTASGNESSILQQNENIKNKKIMKNMVETIKSNKHLKKESSMNNDGNETTNISQSEEGNSIINTPQRGSETNVLGGNTGNSNFNSNNMNHTPVNSVGFSPKNEQLFMSNILKMPNNINFNSPIRNMNEFVFHNFQNGPRGINPINANQAYLSMMGGMNPMNNMNTINTLNKINSMNMNDQNMQGSMNSVNLQNNIANNIPTNMQNNLPNTIPGIVQNNYGNNFNQNFNNYPYNNINMMNQIGQQIGHMNQINSLPSNPNQIKSMSGISTTNNINMNMPVNNPPNPQMNNQAKFGSSKPNKLIEDNNINQESRSNNGKKFNTLSKSPTSSNLSNHYEINTHGNSQGSNNINNQNVNSYIINPNNMNGNINPNFYGANNPIKKNFTNGNAVAYNYGLSGNPTNSNSNLANFNNIPNTINSGSKQYNKKFFNISNNIVNNNQNSLIHNMNQSNALYKMKYLKSDKNVTSNTFKNENLQNGNMLFNFNNMGGMMNNYNIININNMPSINQHNTQNFNNLRIPNTNRIWRNNILNKSNDYQNLNNQTLNESDKNFNKSTDFKTIKEELGNQNIKIEDEFFSNGKSYCSIAEEEFKEENINDINCFTLSVSVKLLNRQEFIYLTKDDEPLNTARLFVSKHGLNENLISPIAESIKQSIISIKMILDYSLTDTDRKTLSEIQKIYQDKQEEDFNMLDIKYHTDNETTIDDLSIQTADELKITERLNNSI